MVAVMRVRWLLVVVLSLCCLTRPSVAATHGRPVSPSTISGFSAWFSEHGGRLHSKVKFEAGAGGSRLRAVTTGRVTAEQELVAVPRQLLLAPVPDSKMGATDFPPLHRLAVRLAEEVMAGEKSLWAPYLAILPPPPLDSALFFTEDDVKELQGTYASHVTFAETQEFDTLLERMRSNPKLQRFVTHDKGAMMRWCLGIAKSRAFTIGKPRDPSHPYHQTPFLAPGADFLNHHPAATIAWRLGEPARALSTAGSSTAPEDVEAFQIFGRAAYPRAGMEVFNHYHDFANARLLATYGFALDDNPFESLPITLSTPGGAGTPKARFLRAMKLGPTQYLTRDGLTPSILNLVRVLAMDDAAFTPAGLKELAILNPAPGGDADAPEVSFDMTADGDMVPVGVVHTPGSVDEGLHGVDARAVDLEVSADVEAKALRMLLDALHGMEASYPSSIALDQKLLGRHAKGSGSGSADASVDWSRSRRGHRRGGRRGRVKRRGRNDEDEDEDGSAVAPDLSPRSRAIIQTRLSERELLRSAMNFLQVKLTHMKSDHQLVRPGSGAGLAGHVAVMGDGSAGPAGLQRPAAPAQPPASRTVPEKKEKEKEKEPEAPTGLRAGSGSEEGEVKKTEKVPAQAVPEQKEAAKVPADVVVVLEEDKESVAEATDAAASTESVEAATADPADKAASEEDASSGAASEEAATEGSTTGLRAANGSTPATDEPALTSPELDGPDNVSHTPGVNPGTP